jgi:amino acid adenylation domain-containing protein
MGMHIGLPLNEACLEKACALLTRRHPLLRTAFDHLHFSEPLQFVYAKAEVPIQIFDIQHLSSARQEEEVERFMREEKWHKFDWSKAPFLRIAVHKRNDNTNQFTFSHPLFDGWSMGLLITEFFTIYGVLLKSENENESPNLSAPPDISYRDFVALERSTMRSEASLKYWQALLLNTDRGELPRWPLYRKAPPGNHIRVTVKVDEAVLTGLQQLAAKADVPFKSVLLAAHMRVVGLMTGRTDVTTGLLVNGRPEQENADKIIGMFLNTIPFKVSLKGDSWNELVKDTFESERTMLPHRRFPLAELVRTYGGGKQWFETAFNYIHFHIYKNLEQVPGLSVLGWKSPSDQTYFPLTAYFHLDISKESKELLFFLDIDTGVLDQQQIDVLPDYYLNTLKAMAGEDLIPYKEIPLLPSKENKILLQEWNRVSDDNDIAEQNPFVHQRLSEQAKLHPQKIALMSGDASISYAALEGRANQLAHYLRGLGISSNAPVGIYIERSIDLVLALFAVLKAGGAYVPLDPIYPKDRLKHMLLDSGAEVVLTQTALVTNLPEGPFQTIDLDASTEFIDRQPTEAPELILHEEDLAYIIYTSGSTGKPKGVEVPHRALGNLISAMQKTLSWNKDDCMLAVTTISFDIAGLEIYLPLTTGAQLVLASRELSMDGISLAEALNKTNITTMQATPATWKMVLSSGWTGRMGLRALCGGERMPQDLAADLLERGCKLWNMYGPTETTIWSTAYEITSGKEAPSIGRPIANTSLYVLDAFSQPVPIGVAGELYIGGRGLARGYHNLPELTEEKFLKDPFSDKAHALMYRTGDLVRYRPDGALEYLSRLDNQVKVRGFRIELGEIETALHAIFGKNKAIVTILKDGFGDNKIAAYLLQSAAHAFNNTELRAKLLEKLPTYMLPSAFVVLEQFPMTLNGKIDYKSLPLPDASGLKDEASYQAPETDLQSKIQAIFAETLGLERCSIDDNFFDMGGHSLSLVRVHVQLQELCKRKIPIVKLFEHSTIRKMAALFEDSTTKNSEVPTNAQRALRQDWLGKQRARRNKRNALETVMEEV